MKRGKMMLNKKQRNSYYNKKTNKKLVYLDAMELNEKYPNYTPKVTREISLSDLNKQGEIKKVLDQDIMISCHPIGTFIESKYRTLGFIICEDGECVLVKKRNYNKRIIAMLSLLLLLVSLWAGWLFLQKANQEIDPNAKDYISALQRPKDVEESKVLIPGYGTFTIAKNSKVIDTVLFNPKNNPCYFKFTLTDKKTGNVLYESKLVPPGKGIVKVEMNKAFNERGSYEGVLKIQTFDLKDTSIAYNGSDIDVLLEVVE